MVAALTALIAACSPSTGSPASVSADDPTPAELGIFADVRGWIAYGNDEGIWAVNPTPGGPNADRILLSGRPGEPLAWSSDGSKLLINRGDPSYLGPDELVVLNSDGSETILVHGAPTTSSREARSPPTV